MKNLYSFFALFIFFIGNSQVGIGTTSPNAQLDIRSSNVVTPSNNDGILIPKIDEFPSTNPTILQDGIMVFATGNGSVSKGFYYWDNTTTSWIGIVSGNNSDDDWYEQSTTNAPNDINDNIYHLGNVGIGQGAANSPLDVFSTDITTPTARFQKYSTLTTGTRVGIDHILSTNTNGAHYGFANYIIHPTTTFQTYGFHNNIDGLGPNTGYYNNFQTLGGGTQIGFQNFASNSSTSGTHNTYGLKNDIVDYSQGNLVGLDNNFGKSSTNGEIIGVNNFFTGTRIKTGMNNNFSVESNLRSDGVRSDFNGFGNGQINGISNIITNSGTGTHTGVNNFFTGTGTGTKIGINNTITLANNTSQIYGLYNNISGNGLNYGIYNAVSNNNTFSGSGFWGYYNYLSGSSNGTVQGNQTILSVSGGGTHYGSHISIYGGGSGNKYGYYTLIDPATGGTNHFGVYSEVLGVGTTKYAGYFLGKVSIGTTPTNNYILPLTRGTSGQIMQTDGAGNVNWINPSALDDGDWSINGTNVYKNNGYVSIGANVNPYPFYIYDSGNTGRTTDVFRDYSGTTESRTQNFTTYIYAPSTQTSFGIFNLIDKPATGANNGNVLAQYNAAYNRYNGSVTSDSFASRNFSYKYNGTNGTSYGNYNYAYNQSGTTAIGIYATHAGGATTNWAAYFAGNVFTTGAYLPSASLLKYNVKEAPSSISKLSLLKVKEYFYKTEEFSFMNLPSGNQTGFIAEEMEKIFPELVTKTIHPESDEELVKQGLEKKHDKIEFKAVNYTGLVPHLVKAIQEQQTEIDKLKQENKELKEKIDYILSKINK